MKVKIFLFIGIFLLLGIVCGGLIFNSFFCQGHSSENIKVQDLVDNSLKNGEDIICIGSGIDDRGYNLERCNE